ncbi:MAG: TolC family protein [Cyanobacteria bacterium J06627_28]
MPIEVIEPMRFFKLVTFLLLTTSSAVSLLSQAAMSVPEAATGIDPVAEPVAGDRNLSTATTTAAGPSAVKDSDEYTVVDTTFVDEPPSLENQIVIQGPAGPMLNARNAGDASDYSFLRVAEVRHPQFSRLLRRLNPADSPEAQSPDIAADNDSAGDVVSSEVAQIDAVPVAQADEDLPALETPDADESSPVPESMPESPTAPEIEAADEDAEETDSSPQVPGSIDSDVGSDVGSDADIDSIPDILFADPNPLSYPTIPEEIDVDRNPVITIDQAVELAYQNSQILQRSLLSLEQAGAALDQARAAQLPTVSTGADLTNTQDNGSRTVLGGSVEVNYNLLTGGNRRATIRTAELQQEVSALAVEVQQEAIRLATSNAYYELQDAGEQIRINQSFLEEADRNLRDARLRQEVGVGTRFDTLRAEVQFANARQSLIQSQAAQRVARRDIARVLNLPPTTGITTTPVQVADTWGLTLEDSILLAFQNRSELEQQLLQADITEEQRQIALSAIRPQVGLFARYSAQETLEGASIFTADGDTLTFGARFSMVLFDGGAARAGARQQEIAGEIAEEQFSESLDQVRFDVEQAYFNLQSNRENIATSEVAVVQAQEALELANLRLQAGVGTQLDVLTAQRELTEAEGNNVNAILGYNRARVAIERAVSNISGPFLP